MGASSEGGNTTSSRGQVRPRVAGGIACLLYPGNATLRETSGIGTVGHCLPGDFNFDTNSILHITANLHK